MADASLTNEHAPTTKSHTIDIPSEKYDSRFPLVDALPSPNTSLNFQGSPGQAFGVSLMDTYKIEVLNIGGHSVSIGTSDTNSNCYPPALMAKVLKDGYILLDTDVTTWLFFIRIEKAFGGRSSYPTTSHTLRVEKMCVAVEVRSYSTTSPVLIGKMELVGERSGGYIIYHMVVDGDMVLSPMVLSGGYSYGVYLREMHKSASLQADMTKAPDAKGTRFYHITEIMPGVDASVTLPHSDLYDDGSSGVKVWWCAADASLTVKEVADVSAGKVIWVYEGAKSPEYGYFGRIQLESGGHQVKGSGVLLHLGKNFKGTADLTAEEKLEGDRFVQVEDVPNPRATLIVNRCEQVSEDVMDKFAAARALVKSATVGDCVKQAEPSKHSKAVEEEMAAEHQPKERDDRKEMFDEANRIFEKLSITEDEPSAMPSTSISTIGAIGLAVGCALAVVGLCAMFVMKGVFAKRAEEKNTHDDEVSQL